MERIRLQTQSGWATNI